MHFLSREVAAIVESHKEQQHSLFDFVCDLIDGNSPLNTLLHPISDDVFSKLIFAYIDGYELDESENYQEIGLLDHSFFVKEWTDYQPTFAIFYFIDGDFSGKIWMPYYSKENYEANLSFCYKDEKTSLNTSRINDIHLAPIWFQELFHACDTYINTRYDLESKEPSELERE